jgi:hypothetical protein
MVGAQNSVHHRHMPLLVAANCLSSLWTAYSSTYKSNNNDNLVIQYWWSRKHKVESPCGAQAATASSE